MKSVRGIYYDITESSYKFNFKGYTLYFSSQLYLDKFKSEIRDYIEYETNRLKVKYYTNFDASDLLIFVLYSQIEKRGFYITTADKEYNSIPNFKIEAYYGDTI